MPLDRAEMEQLMSTNPSPEETRAWLRQKIDQHAEPNVERGSAASALAVAESPPQVSAP